MADADEAEAVVEICRRLDGIPLAIELAASRMASMTVVEVRDRLDQRFRLLIGSRRGLERHQTLRHAVAWSYDLLEDAEKAVLDRCSVFAGGFDLESACAVADSTSDDFATLDLLDALVRKSLLVADRSSGRTRFSMLETIRQFAEEQLVARGEASEIRAAHAQYFAAREADILALWDGPRQREAYKWFNVELANLRTAFRWAADHGDLDNAAAIATYAAFLGMWVENHEPISLGRRAHRARPRRRPSPARGPVRDGVAVLMPGGSRRPSATARPAQSVLGSGRYEVPFGIEGWLGLVYWPTGSPNDGRVVPHPAGTRPRHPRITRACLIIALAMTGSDEEARAATNGLIDAAEATGNPFVLSLALWAYGYAFRDADPVGALDGLRRGLVIAQDSGNRINETLLAASCPASRPNTATRWPRSITSLWRSATTTTRATPLSAPRWLSSPRLFDRLGRYEPAATIAGFAVSPITAARRPRAQHRDRPPTRGPRRPGLRIARPQGRDDDHRRHGDLRIRPNRPGPRGAERRLEIDDI